MSDNERQSRADRTKWLKELRAAIPKTSGQITPKTLEIWSRRLLRVPMPVLIVAANILAERLTFFPSLAEILAICREVESRVDNRKWKANLERWEQAALSPGEATKMLRDITNAANVKIKAAIVPFLSQGSGAKDPWLRNRGHGLTRILAIGGAETDEEFTERKRALIEKAE